MSRMIAVSIALLLAGCGESANEANQRADMHERIRALENRLDGRDDPISEAGSINCSLDPRNCKPGQRP